MKVARTFFMISAIYGLFLRLFKVIDLPFEYKNILQAHSHVTFLGWGFLAVISLIGFVYYPKKIQNSKYLKRLFLVMTMTLTGMLISFPLQGYKVFSILFLSVFLIASYFYLIKVLKILKPVKTYSVQFIKTGIYYYFLSSIAVWAIAIITVKTGKTILYYNAIYFYLHFLYNGFFVFTLFGLFLKYLENSKIKIEKNLVKYFYIFTNIACIPAYAMSLLWSKVSVSIYLIAGIAGILQLVSLFYLFKLAKIFLKTELTKHVKYISIIVFASYFLKVILQFFSVFPNIMRIALQLKFYFIIGYLHLFTLGFMSLFIIMLLLIFPKLKLSKKGLNILIIGILLSEFFLFFQGFLTLIYKPIQHINWILFIASALMPIGIVIVHFTLKKLSSNYSIE